MKKPRHLTPEEKALWALVTQNDIPLVPSPGEERNTAPQPAREKHVVRRIAQDAPVVTTGKHTPQPLAQGAYANIDRNTAERFRKGKAAIEASLDLHGMTRDHAYSALVRFIASHYQRGTRCVLVITGKGVRQTDTHSAQGGVLKSLLPRWLAEDALMPMILAFDKAQPKHGGSGAFYILLKRKR